MIRFITRITFFMLITALFSCEEMTYLFNCLDCETEEPSEGPVEIRIDQGFINNNTINIYEGDLDDNNLVGTYIAYDDRYSLTLPLNRKYTVTATYTYNGKVYIAVNQVMPRVRDMKDKCGDTCFIVYDNVCRLRLLGI